MAAKPRGRLTPKVRELVATDRQSRPPVGRLTTAQVELLTAVARGREEYDVPVSTARALGALAAGAKPEVAVPVLETVLADSKAPEADRIAAARGLGSVATEQAERALLEHVRIRDPRVQQDVFAALGLFAGPAAEQALAGLAPPANPFARRQLAFARALIAHRHGLDGPFLREARPVERRPGRPEEMTAFALGARTPNGTAADLERLRGPTYGVDFADRALSLTCGPAEWTIFVNQEIGRSALSPTNLFDRPWIAAVLAQRLPRREALTTRFALLTRPTGGQAHLDVARADGEIVYTGTAEPAGPGLAFTISDVDRPGTAPLNVVGRLTSRGIELETAVVFALRVGVRETLPAP
jgi:hypothetical protein